MLTGNPSGRLIVASCAALAVDGTVYGDAGWTTTRYWPGATSGKRYSPGSIGYVAPAPSVTVWPVKTIDGHTVTPSGENVRTAAPVTASTNETLAPLTGAPSSLSNTRPNGSTNTLSVALAIGLTVSVPCTVIEIVSLTATLRWQSPWTGLGGIALVGTAPTNTPVLGPVSKIVTDSRSPELVTSVAWIESTALTFLLPAVSTTRKKKLSPMWSELARTADALAIEALTVSPTGSIAPPHIDGTKLNDWPPAGVMTKVSIVTGFCTTSNATRFDTAA